MTGGRERKKQLLRLLRPPIEQREAARWKGEERKEGGVAGRR